MIDKATKPPSDFLVAASVARRTSPCLTSRKADYGPPLMFRALAAPRLHRRTFEDGASLKPFINILPAQFDDP